MLLRQLTFDLRNSVVSRNIISYIVTDHCTSFISWYNIYNKSDNNCIERKYFYLDKNIGNSV